MALLELISPEEDGSASLFLAPPFPSHNTVQYKSPIPTPPPTPPHLSPVVGVQPDEAPVFPVTSYHTNDLGLFSNETGLPLFTEAQPTLSNLVAPQQSPPTPEPTYSSASPLYEAPLQLVPPSPLHSSSSRSRSGHRRVGPWLQDADGHVIYTGAEQLGEGRIEKLPEEGEDAVMNIYDDGSESGLPELAVGHVQCMFGCTQPLPVDAPPPPAPRRNFAELDLEPSMRAEGDESFPVHGTFHGTDAVMDGYEMDDVFFGGSAPQTDLFPPSPNLAFFPPPSPTVEQAKSPLSPRSPVRSLLKKASQQSLRSLRAGKSVLGSLLQEHLRALSEAAKEVSFMRQALRRSWGGRDPALGACTEIEGALEAITSSLEAESFSPMHRDVQAEAKDSEWMQTCEARLTSLARTLRRLHTLHQLLLHGGHAGEEKLCQKLSEHRRKIVDLAGKFELLFHPRTRA